MNVISDEIVITGCSICKSVGVGKLYILCGEEEGIPQLSLMPIEVDNEVHRYRQAVRRTRQEIRELKKQLTLENLMEAAMILESHLQFLRDPLLTLDIEKSIRLLQQNAEYVFHKALESFRRQFQNLPDPYFQERSFDIEDIGRRIMRNLMAYHHGVLAEIPPQSVIYAHDLTPSLVAEAIRSKVVAFITETGGITSHAAIVARSKGIPYISSIPYSSIKDSADASVIVDGRKGEVILHPSKETLLEFSPSKHKHKEEFKQLGLFQTETFDGYTVGLSANIDVDSELEMLHQYGGSGVGLYRSELVFLNYTQFPSEEEQYTIYRGVIEKLKGLPIVIRTFDVGGDKDFISHSLPKGGASSLGCRAIRFLLKEKDLFRHQIRAILRAAYSAEVRIMFPMVSSLAELLEAKAIVKEVQNDLQREGALFNNEVKIGCMIEVPSAAIISDLLAAECDFLSIGTNDLVQYSLAVDRLDGTLNDFHNAAHPSIIRLIKYVVGAAHRYNIPVSVCGEVASDARFVPLLLGLGVQQLSVAARFLPEIKLAIRKTSIVRAIQLADAALRLGSSQAITELLEKEYAEISN